jgi:hypothetical protein
MRRIRMWLAAPALMAFVVVPAGTGTAPAAKAAQTPGARAAGARAASVSPDDYEAVTAVDFCNSSGACGQATLWLNDSTDYTTGGYLHAELASTGDANDPNPPIPGSEVALETSGYGDFRNVPYTWRGWVPSSGSQQWYANTQDVYYRAPGDNWWWRACGYIGSASACTLAVKFTRTSDGWQITYYNG